MRVATQTSELSRMFGDEKAVRLLAEIGFDAIDFSMFETEEEVAPVFGRDYENYARHLKHVADECGICFNQSHAPFPSLRVDDDPYNQKITPLIHRAIAVTSILGAKIVIVHPIAGAADQKEFNMEFYNSLIPACKEYGVRVALENMFGGNPNNGQIIPNVCSTGREFAEYVDALDSRYFTACLDLGHAGLVGETAENMIRTLGHDRLKALHVHDNNHVRDLHTLPFTQSLDWKAITQALKDIKYTGDFTFEADNFLLKFPKELAVPACKLMLETGRYLAAQCE